MPHEAQPPHNLLLRRARSLEILTVAWNAVEAVVAVSAGVVAGSVALVGFGLDSVIEVVAAAVVLWRLNERVGGSDDESDEQREHVALRVVGGTFFALAIYILYEAGSTLWRHEAPEASPVGIVLACVSLIVMPLLGLAKRRTGQAMGSRALVADATETMICAYLSFTLVLGLALRAALGWWWADPVAALLMIPLIVREGVEAFE